MTAPQGAAAESLPRVGFQVWGQFTTWPELHARPGPHGTSSDWASTRCGRTTTCSRPPVPRPPPRRASRDHSSRAG